MDWLLIRFKSSPDSVAFIHKGLSVKYGMVSAKIEKYRMQLQEDGIKAGDVVVIVGDFSPNFYSLFLSLGLMGAVVVPLSPDSMVEADDLLDVSGCDWQIIFESEGDTFTCKQCLIESRSQLLAKFRASKGRSGLILFSSGSTGKPKGILHDLPRVAEKFRKQRKPIISIPFLLVDHFGGINTLLSITSSLGTVVTSSDRSVAGICKAVEQYRVELLPTTPSFLTLLTGSRTYLDYDMSSLKRITYGTEVMPQATLDRLRTAFPVVELLQTYGLSEVGVLHSKSRPDGSLWFQIGGDGFHIKIVDNVLWIKSDFAMIGYLNAPSSFDDDGWFNTQDQVEVDGDYIRILGRSTDIINVGGQKVYPSEVENILLQAKNIRDVAVYGEPHPLLGYIVVAKVILNEYESLISVKKSIRNFALSKLAAFKVPSKVVIVEGPLHGNRHKKIRKATVK
jgi:acyl-CoA synthetase (AMP-forming)/AMP-acid ligase II